MKNYNAASGEPLWNVRDRLMVGADLGQADAGLSCRAASRYEVLSALEAGQETRRSAPKRWSRLTWRRSRATVAKTV